MAGDYYSSSKAARDAAEGSVLLADLGTINAVRLWLEPFKFVEIARDMRRAGLYSKGRPPFDVGNSPVRRRIRTV